MSYRVEVHKTIESISQDQWSMLNVSSCYQSYSWLQIVEARRSPHVYYVSVIDNEGGILAVAPCYVAHNPDTYVFYNARDILAGTFASNVIQKHLSLTQQQIHHQYALSTQEKLGSHLFPNLLCTTREGYASGPMFRKDLNAQVVNEIASILVDGVIRLGQELMCVLTAFLYVERFNPVHTVLSNDNCYQVAMGAGTHLKLNQGGFDNYLQSLSGSRRYSVRREVLKFQESNLVIKIQTLAELSTTRLSLLLQNVQAKYGHIAGSDNVKTHIQRLKRIPLPSRVYVAYVQDEIAGFALFFQYRDALYARLVGFDYDLLNKNDHCYFNVLFYQPISDALKMGLNRIDYGQGALGGKLGRGCDLVPIYGYFFVPDSFKDEILQANTSLITRAYEQEYTSLQEEFLCTVL